MKERVEIWQRRTSKQIADCRVFRVREDACERDSDGAAHNFFVVEAPDWVNVIALTKEKEIVLIEQYRQGTEEITLEIPGGMIDAGEEPAAAARRELAEETGYEAKEFILLGKSRPNPAIQTNWMYHYLALDCEKTRETAFDEHESLATNTMPLTDISELILAGKITHSLAIAAFQYFSLQSVKVK
jgi:8-oxo-dGTP pyrophosphatase MutT (NUDIX family)